MEFFHVLNRGVDKRSVFLDDIDYIRFIHNLFAFNDQENTNPNHGYFLGRKDKGAAMQYMDVRRPYIAHKRKLLVHLHCFALMPNHFHLLLSPAIENGVSLFMKKLNGGYTKYFNEKYERGGALWQGKYKSVPITTDAHFLHIPFYIHFNPLDMRTPDWRERKIALFKEASGYLESYRWSSHLDYLGKHNFPSVTQRGYLTKIFEESGGYQKVFKNQLRDFSIETLANVMLE